MFITGVGWAIGLHIFARMPGCVTHAAYTHAVAVLQGARFRLDMGEGYHKYTQASGL